MDHGGRADVDAVRMFPIGEGPESIIVGVISTFRAWVML